MRVVEEIIRGCSQLFFPHGCAGCGSDLLDREELICLRCHHQLPFTRFESFSGNPVEKIFWGRAPLAAGSAHLYFTKDSPLQNMLHQFKYHGKKQLGIFLGNMMGESIHRSGRFREVDVILPMPLFPSREKKRGYNQALLLSEGISEMTNIPVWAKCLVRTKKTDTQTHMNRLSRWQNMSGKFELKEKETLRKKHVLLVDDVITTGATLDACMQTLLEVEGIRISIAALAYTIL